MGRIKLSDQRGIATVAIIGVVILVAAVGGVGYMVYSKNNKSSSSESSQASSAINAEAEKACLSLYNDKDLCKFASNFTLGDSAYKASFTSQDNTGVVTNFTMESDKKGNTATVSKEGNTETYAFISLDGDTYVKDYTDNTWIKYPKSPDAPVESTPTEDLDIDFNEEESKAPESRTVYKKIGKEGCGNTTCFKYQIIEPEQPDIESFIWFDDKDYVLRKFSTKDSEGYSEGTFEYTNVNITAPSPVKEAPSFPSADDIQQQLQQAQESYDTGSEE